MAASFADFAIAQVPGLAARLAQKDATDWLAKQETMVVDGETMVLIWGDRLVDEGEAKLGWAREHGLVDDARIAALHRDFGGDDPNTETIDLN